MNQGIPGQGMPHGMMPDIMGQIAQNMPGTQMPGSQMPGLPPIQGLPPGGATPMPGLPPGGVTPMPGLPPGGVTPMPGRVPQNIDGAMAGMPPTAKGPSLASGALPSNNNQLDSQAQAGGIAISSNPSLSPTDAMVNRIAEAERTVKNERRSQWLQMNQESAANVLTSIGG